MDSVFDILDKTYIMFIYILILLDIYLFFAQCGEMRKISLFRQLDFYPIYSHWKLNFRVRMHSRMHKIIKIICYIKM